MPKGIYPRQALEQRFTSKIKPSPCGCHEWQSTIHRDGYGRFWFINGQTQAHRMAYVLFVGEIPKKMMVLHRCDNRKCVNPKHLYLGNAALNAADRTKRLRYKISVSMEQVKEIRRRYAQGDISQQSLANEFGVSQTQVSKYITHKQRALR